MGKSSPSPPPTPDYAGAAKATAQGDKEAARVAGMLNNPNVDNPYGTQTVSFGETYKDQPTITQTFKPEQQALYDQQVATQLQLGNLGQQGATSLEGVIGKPVDFSGQPPLPTDAGAYRQDVQDAMMARQTVDLNRERENTKAKLLAGGHQEGGQGYNYAMDTLNRKDTDMRNQAILAAGNETSRQYGLSEAMRRQGITEYLSKRQTPLNEVIGLTSGSQVQNPFTVPGYQGGAQLQGPNLLGATTAQGQYDQGLYNTKSAAVSSANSGMMNLLGTGLMGAGLAY